MFSINFINLESAVTLVEVESVLLTLSPVANIFFDLSDRMVRNGCVYVIAFISFISYSSYFPDF